MLEIEMKFPASDFASIQAHLQRWGAKARPAVDEVDHYFNAPDRDFGRSDEAFRLRCSGDTNRITYKGPKQGGPTKTRTEIEIAIEPGGAAAEKYRQLVQHLGYRPTAVVKKRRVIYEFTRAGSALQACCDEVETLGKFVEIEIMAEPAHKEQAQGVLLQAARELGLENSEPRSYLELILAKPK